MLMRTALAGLRPWIQDGRELNISSGIRLEHGAARVGDVTNLNYEGTRGAGELILNCSVEDGSPWSIVTTWRTDPLAPLDDRSLRRYIVEDNASVVVPTAAIEVALHHRPSLDRSTSSICGPWEHK